MQTKWETQHRKVLVRLVTDVDSDVTQVDVAACSAALGLSRQQVHESLAALVDGRLIDLRYVLDAGGEAVARVISVSAMARQICSAAPTGAFHHARPAVSTIDEVVLRATAGP